NRQLSEATHELTQLNLQLVRSTEKIVEATRILSDTYDQLDAARAELLERDSRLMKLTAQLAIATAEISDLREGVRNDAGFAQLKITTLAAPPNAAPQSTATVVWNPTTQQGL